PVRGLIFVLRTLENWRKEGGPPADPPPPPAAPRPAAPGPEEPPRRLTAEELAELVEQCRGANRGLRKLGRITLKKALAAGANAEDLAATIPGELVEPHRRE